MPNKLRVLSDLIGHLAAGEQREEFSQLQDFLGRGVFSEDASPLRSRSFSFEAADLFSPELIAEARSAEIRRVAEREGAGEFRLFVREVPQRSTQLHGSNPLWASGAAPERSFGPFINRDGRRLWFDFFRIEKLVALYVQGVAEPALLFKITTGFRFLDLIRPLTAEAQSSYRLGAGSVWINSRLLASSAPAGFFTGLTIRSGSIALSAAPTEIASRLTIAPTTTARVQLQLAPQAVTDADAASAYGKDARAAEVALPAEFAFHFAGASHALDLVGQASWRVFGHAAEFAWRQQQGTSYDAFVNRVLIPMTASAETFEGRENLSKFHALRGETKIAASFWALPTAAIDVANPSPAEGIGALLIRGETGLTSQWTALRGGALTLRQPYVMAAPGRVAVSDPAAGNARYRQEFQLWRDQRNTFGTTAEFQYQSAAPFFFNTTANGVELVSTLGHADVRADRPVTARGEPLEIRSKNSLLTIAATSAFRLVYLFDDNILADHFDPKKKPPEPPKSLSLVLRNALFKTTPVNGCLLFGTLAEDFVNVERASLFLTLGLHAYLPTLPDPYAANVNALKFQFRGATDRSLAGSNLPSVWMLLVCRVQWEPVTAKEDKVEVSFHFAPLPGQPAWTPETAGQDVDFAKLVGGEADAGVDPQSHTPVRFPRKLALPTPDYGAVWRDAVGRLQQDTFALLDVSTNADLLGVSFGSFGGDRVAMLKTLAPAGSGFPLQVRGMDVVSRGINVRAFTVPQNSWEPVINLTPPNAPPFPPDPSAPPLSTIKDPPAGPNYYPDDGGPTRLINNSAEQASRPFVTGRCNLQSWTGTDCAERPIPSSASSVRD